MKYVVVLPFVNREFARSCMATYKFPFECMCLVDNSEMNIGIMRSHNLGVDKLYRDDADWLVVLSAALRFGNPGGLDFIEHLRNNPNHLVIEATPVYGWHLIAFSRRVLDKVGKWDENFSPYGFCDLDMSWRIQCATQQWGWEGPIWDKFPVDVHDTGMAHSINKFGLRAPADPLIAYYEMKWGVRPGTPHEDAYRTPFNRKDVGLDFWPKPLHDYSSPMAQLPQP